MLNKRFLIFSLSSLTLMLSIFMIGDKIARHQSLPLISSFFVACIAYFILVKCKNDFSSLFSVGLVVRLFLFFSMPSLSDDYFRFLWDGILLANGINPFHLLPEEALRLNIQGLNEGLYNQLNSQQHFTIYPPVSQWIFWVTAKIAPSNWLLGINFMRSIMLINDVLILFILQKLLLLLKKPPHLAFWYFLNPLIILEGVGNLHFEGLVVLFVLLSIYLWYRHKYILSGMALALSIATKLLPLIYIPYLLLEGLHNQKWRIVLFAFIFCLVMFFNFLTPEFLNGFSDSLSLYFRNFEFNASIYFLLRALGFWLYGYNIIQYSGPILSIISFCTIAGVAIWMVIQKQPVFKVLLFTLSIYLIFATTVHPWYVLPLVAYGVLSGYFFPLVWSLMVFLSYIGYTLNGYDEPLIFIFVEYSVVFIVMIYEVFFKSKKYFKCIRAVY